LTPERLAEEMSALLGTLTQAYSRLEATGVEQRDAIRTADTRRLAIASAEQDRISGEISRLDAKRREIVALACSTFTELRTRPANTMTLRDLVRCTPLEQREGLSARAKALRTLIARVQSQQSSLSGIAHGLLSHVEGVLRQVARSISHAGTYGPKGFVEAGGSVMTSLDLRT
jgi:hypothetical protein